MSSSPASRAAPGAGFGAQVVVGLVGRIARRRRQRRGNRIAEKADAFVDAAPQFPDTIGAGAFGIDVDPVAEDDIPVRDFRFERVVVQRPHFIERAILGIAEVEDRADVRLAEIVCHFVLGVIARLGVPGVALLGQFLFGLQRIAATRFR